MGYGFPYHDWDTVPNKKIIKLGTMANKPIINGQPTTKTRQVDNSDDRVKAAIDYVTRYMNNLKVDPVANYVCPIVFY